MRKCQLHHYCCNSLDSKYRYSSIISYTVYDICLGWCFSLNDNNRCTECRLKQVQLQRITRSSTSQHVYEVLSKYFCSYLSPCILYSVYNSRDDGLAVGTSRVPDSHLLLSRVGAHANLLDEVVKASCLVRSLNASKGFRQHLLHAHPLRAVYALLPSLPSLKTTSLQVEAPVRTKTQRLLCCCAR